MDASAVVSFLRHYVAYFLFAGNPPYGPLFHERLRRGKTLLHNPLFLKTNRILTMLWGILYLFTSVFTWFLMRTPVSSFCGPYQLRSAISWGFYSLVPELVSGEVARGKS